MHDNRPDLGNAAVADPALDMRPVFIVGGSRTGSELHRTILRNSLEIDLIDEMWLLCPVWLHPDFESTVRREIGDLRDDRNIEELVRLMYSGRLYGYFWTVIGQEIDRNLLRGELMQAPRTLQGVFAALLKVHAAANHKSIPGAKFPVHYSYAERLIEWFPDCRIIHTVRDPRAVYASQATKHTKDERSMSKVLWKRLQTFVHINIQSWWTTRVHERMKGRGGLIQALDGCDVAIGRRWPRAGSRFEAIRRATFHGLVGWVTNQHLRDLGCSARALKRRVLEEISVYGDQHRFLPVLADRQGFRVREIDVRQSPQDMREQGYELREYANRALDIVTILFLVRFTKKPLRFFGMLGVITFGPGALFTAYLVIERLFFAQPLADRPALLLSSLLVVLGLGELIIFTHARSIKDCQVQDIIHFPTSTAGEDTTRQVASR